MTKRWQDSNAVYQIYPRSFKDTNGDGVGDLRGITEKLSYIADVVGAEAIWLSPFYPSPQTDCGYDVSDYCAIDPLFGTMEDFDDLLSKAHEKGLKVMIDFVPNHTSDQHEWFRESRSNRDNPKREWYVWRDTPNNWRSISGGSSWTLDETSGQYYLHSFMSSQPDLNWENEEVREAMRGVMRFWCDKGVDGFRVDAVWVLSKDPTFADDPVNELYNHPDEYGGYKHTACKNGARLQEYLHVFTDTVAEYDDKFVIFEYYPDAMLGDENQQLRVLHEVDPHHASPFYFEGLHQPWHAQQFGQALETYLQSLPTNARAVFCFSNHDQPRPVSRYGEEQARLIAFLQMTLPGLPVMYYGDEIGMENVTIPPELTKDKFEKTGDSGGRDPERTPMQWDDSWQAGFTSGTPWLPVHDGSIQRNVALEIDDADSWLTLYRQLFALRKEPLLREGSFQVITLDNGYVLAYLREYAGERGYVLLNFADAPQTVTLPERVDEIVVATHPGAAVLEADACHVTLQAFAAVLVTASSGPDSSKE